MKVIYCGDEHHHLTLGVKYFVVKEVGDYFIIINDDLDEVGYHKSQFSKKEIK